METFAKTFLDFILLFGGCIMAIIALALTCLMFFENQNTSPASYWAIVPGVGGCGLIHLSLWSLRRNTENKDE